MEKERTIPKDFLEMMESLSQEEREIIVNRIDKEMEKNS